MTSIVHNGVSLNYRCVGEGEDVVLIHGLAANHAFWHLNVLLPLAREYRVTIYDLRGHGYSQMPHSGYTTADMAEDLNQLLVHLGITHAHLVGHSYGGGIALNYAIRHPEQVQSLTLADTRVRVLQPDQRRTDWSEWERVQKKCEEHGIKIPDDETEIGLYLLEKLASPEFQYVRTRQKGSPLFIPFSGWGGGNRSAEKWLDLLNITTARQDFLALSDLTEENIAKVRNPTLLMYGERSLVLKSSMGLQSLLQDCRMIIVPGAGHFFPVVRPKFFVERLSDFLHEVGSREKTGVSSQAS